MLFLCLFDNDVKFLATIQKTFNPRRYAWSKDVSRFSTGVHMQ